MKTQKQEQEIQKLVLNPIKTRLIKVQIESYPESTLISHRLDAANVENFTNREFGIVKKEEKRELNKEYESCFYYTIDKKHGFPASAFMASILDACVSLNIPKTQIKRSVRILGDIIPLKYKAINRRIDNPRRGGRNKTPDVRHRPEYINWSCELLVQFDESQITPESIINLLNNAGFMSGIGDWRPSSPKSSGTHGMYKVTTK